MDDERATTLAAQADAAALLEQVKNIHMDPSLQ